MSKFIVDIKPELFNPDTIMNSGQVFRMRKDDNKYIVCSGDKFCMFQFNGVSWEFFTSHDDWDFWWTFFDFNTNYSKCNQKILHCREGLGDSFLFDALCDSKGMRILKQDLWETIVTFIISQQNNIPKITKTIEKLCEKFGTKHKYYCGYDINKVFEYHSFPTAVQISDLSLSELSDGSMLGYRAKYILKIAQDVANEDFSLTALQNYNYEESMNMLQSIQGVGLKVANCIALYGLHLMESYPIDTWMKKIMAENYSQYSEKQYMEYINSLYSGFQGYIQQLQFYYKRRISLK